MSEDDVIIITSEVNCLFYTILVESYVISANQEP